MFASALWAYFGPETTLPLMSILAALMGFLLFCWNFVVRQVKRVVMAPFRPSAPAAPAAPLMETPIAARPSTVAAESTQS